MLYRLPPEILIESCIWCDTFDDALALGKASRRLRHFWRENAHKVYLGMAARYGLAFKEAQELEKVQSKDHDLGNDMKTKAQRLRANEQTAHNFVNLFEQKTHPRFSTRSISGADRMIHHLLPTERERLAGFFYELRKLILLEPDAVQHALKEATLRQLWCWDSVCTWISGGDMKLEDFKGLGLPEVEVWFHLMTLLRPAWQEKADRMQVMQHGRPSCDDIALGEAIVVLDQCQYDFVDAIPNVS